MPNYRLAEEMMRLDSVYTHIKAPLKYMSKTLFIQEHLSIQILDKVIALVLPATPLLLSIQIVCSITQKRKFCTEPSPALSPTQLFPVWDDVCGKTQADLLVWGNFVCISPVNQKSHPALCLKKKKGRKKSNYKYIYCIWDLRYGGKWTIYIQTVRAKPGDIWM